MISRDRLPYQCCGERTRGTGHGHYICGHCGRKYDLHGRDLAKEMRGVDIDRIHWKRKAAP